MSGGETGRRWKGGVRAGNWFARAYEEDTGKYRRKALGHYGSLASNEVFVVAKKDAEAWAEQVETGAVPAAKLETVGDACADYLRDKTCLVTLGICRRHVFDDPIASVKLDKLRRHHLRAWRKRLEDSPAYMTRSKKGPVRTKVRAVSTVNRNLAPLRAALFRVLAPGTPNTEAAWQEALKPAKGGERRRDLYLDRSERKRLLEALPSDIQPFIRALCLLPLRPGALAKLSVRDFDSRTRTLTIRTDKTGRSRQIAVPRNLTEFLVEQCAGKSPSESIFARSDGVRWSKDTRKSPIKEAVIAAKLPFGATAYTLRHSVITDLVRSGVPILTVAQLADTGVVMVERHYGHLVRDDAEQALAVLAL